MSQGLAHINVSSGEEKSAGDGWVDSLWKEFIDSKDPDIRAKLVEHYYDYAATIARTIFSQRAWTGLQYDDCLQLALEGLIAAVDRFQANKGASFKTYSSYRIKGAVLNGLDRYSEEYDYAAYKRRLTAEKVSSIEATNTVATDRGSQTALERVMDIAVELALSHLLTESNSLDKLVDETPYGNPGRVVLQRQLLGIVDKLPNKQREIVKRYYFEGDSFVTIAESMGLSKARVSQLHGGAIKQIHQYCVSRNIVSA